MGRKRKADETVLVKKKKLNIWVRHKSTQDEYLKE